MSLNEPRRKQPNDYARLVLEQLHREVVSNGRQESSFTALCDRASIPRDLRAALLQRLLTERYVTQAGRDTIMITPQGMARAASPAPASPYDEPRPRSPRPPWSKEYE